MKPQHIVLAVMVAAVWGFNFVVVRIGLDGIPPLTLAALRFVVSAIPILFLPRPPVAWRRFLILAAFLFVGQFGFLFTAMTHGMPPGLASVLLQSQALFTILIAAVVLKERPTVRQGMGVMIALMGLSTVAATVFAGGVVDVTVTGIALMLAAALSWAVGNVMLRGLGRVDMLALMSWLSVMAFAPLLALSVVVDGASAVTSAILGISGLGLLSVLYIGALSTTFGYGAWGHLLKLYPAASVVPFALLIPVFGTLSSMLVLGESYSPLRLVGMAGVVLGLAVMVLPLPFRHKPPRSDDTPPS